MAIRNWKEKQVQMDFSSMYDGNNHPSDIDLFYLGKDKDGSEVLIIGEMKFGDAIIKDGQRNLLEAFVESYNGTSIILYITHHADIYKGERVIDMGRCRVEQYYYRKPGKRGRWVIPKEPLTVKEVIDRYREVKSYGRY